MGPGGAVTGAAGVLTGAVGATTGVVATTSGVVATTSGVGTVLAAGVTDTGGSTGAIEATRRWWRIRWALR